MFVPLPDCTLPIFWEPGADYTLFYAPGCLVITAPSAAAAVAQEMIQQPPSQFWSERLILYAKHALQVSEKQQTEPFQPECLTLYLHNQCNLNCEYCYAEPDPRRDEHLSSDAIVAAADLVAANCFIKGLPLTVVLHGGGEPSLFQEEAEQALRLVENAAQRYELKQFRYIATNGVLSEAKALWLAANFDLIGLSCDGPPDIQDQQRPRRGGGTTSDALERTAAILSQSQREFHVRATITASTIHRQSEIADYIGARLQPTEMHFEPVYAGGRASQGSEPDLAHEFVTHFCSARAVARHHGIRLSYSGVRLETIHGPYCHTFRPVLNLVPPGVATACFKYTTALSAEQAGVMIGAYQAGALVFDYQRIEQLRQDIRAGDACRECFNRYHCARACPDDCKGAAGSFRCALNKQLATVLLHERAQILWTAAQDRGMVVHGTTL